MSLTLRNSTPKQIAQKLLWKVRAPSTPRADEGFVFVHSTGRCGTKHLAIAYGGEKVYATHEEEHIATFRAMERHLRQIADTGDRAAADAYVRELKIPYMLKQLRLNRKKTFFDSGHQIIFGILPSLVEQLQGHIKLIRLRRDRLQTALSFVTAPEYHDPWMDHWEEKEMVDGERPRWALRPTDEIALVQPTPEQWNRLNRFQRYLWYVDEVERQWQELSDTHSFPSIEIDLETLSEDGYNRISNFTGMTANQGEAGKRHHSTESKKKRAKPDYSLEYMSDMDREYRSVMESAR